jgi:hypothetical protein
MFLMDVGYIQYYYQRVWAVWLPGHWCCEQQTVEGFKAAILHD